MGKLNYLWIRESSISRIRTVRMVPKRSFELCDSSPFFGCLKSPWTTLSKSRTTARQAHLGTRFLPHKIQLYLSSLQFLVWIGAWFHAASWVYLRSWVRMFHTWQRDGFGWSDISTQYCMLQSANANATSLFLTVSILRFKLQVLSTEPPGYKHTVFKIGSIAQV